MNIKKLNKKLNNNFYILKVKDINDTKSDPLASFIYADYSYFLSLNGEPYFCTLTDNINKTKRFKTLIDAKQFVSINKLTGFDIVQVML